MGEDAVARLRIVQGPVRRKAASASTGVAAVAGRRRNKGPLDAAAEAELLEELSDAPEGQLKAALLRLGREVRRSGG